VRKATAFISALVLSILTVSPVLSQDRDRDRGRRRAPDPPARGQAVPRERPRENPPPPRAERRPDRDDRRTTPPPQRVVPRTSPRYSPSPRYESRRPNLYGRRLGFPGLFLEFRYHYPFPYYYPRYSPYERAWICNRGHWDYDEDGNTIWVIGYCNIPSHHHDSCYYYYDCGDNERR